MKPIERFEQGNTSMQKLIESFVDWVDSVCDFDTYDMYLLVSDHYPFGVDSPFMMLLTKDSIAYISIDWECFSDYKQPNGHFVPIETAFFSPEEWGYSEEIIKQLVDNPDSHTESTLLDLADAFFNKNTETDAEFWDDVNYIDRMSCRDGQSFKEFIYEWCACECGLATVPDELVNVVQCHNMCMTDMIVKDKQYCDGHCYDCEYEKRGEMDYKNNRHEYDDGSCWGLNAYMLGRRKKGIEDVNNEGTA